MGKYGSKRRLTVEECIALNVSELADVGLFEGAPMKRWVLRWTRGK